MSPDKPHYLGHRERLRSRFDKVGYLGMHDYEILELLLCLCIPRGVGKQTVHLLKIMLATHQRLTQISMYKPNILSNLPDILNYCYTHMSFERVEEIRILFLNTKMGLIHDEVHQKGTVDQSAFYSNEIIKRALDLGSTGIVIIHNHPSGDATPSMQDKKITLSFMTTAKSLSITLHDHIIIGKNNYYSFKQHHLL